MSTGHSGLSGAGYSVFISVGTSWSIKPQNRGLYSNNRVADLASYLLLLIQTAYITLKANKTKAIKVMLFLID